jgi:hypothetical protein
LNVDTNFAVSRPRIGSESPNPPLSLLARILNTAYTYARMHLGLEVVGRSDVGRVRPSNEDSFGFDLRLDSDFCFGLGLVFSLGLNLLSFFITNSLTRRDSTRLWLASANLARVQTSIWSQSRSNSVPRRAHFRFAEGVASTVFPAHPTVGGRTSARPQRGKPTLRRKMPTFGVREYNCKAALLLIN